MRLFKYLLIVIALVSITQAEAKYQIFADPIAVGDTLKPETGAAFAVQSTSETSLPCPKMTEVQRDALAVKPVGSCIFNTTSASSEFYNGSSWLKAGSGAVISLWTIGTAYGVGAFVYTTPDFKLYLANTSHTAGATFPGDIANWDEASPTEIVDLATADVTGTLPTANGGTGSTATTYADLTANVNGILPIANGGTNSSTALNNSLVMISNAGAIEESATISVTELGHLNTVSSNIQDQLDTKLETVDLTSDVGVTILPIANGGTGSATQNFVDLTTAQSIAGIKTFSAKGVLSAGIDINDTSTIDSTGATDALAINHSGAGEALSLTQAGAGEALAISGGKLTIDENIEMSGTGSITIPVGTTAQRPTPVAGMLRRNTTTASFEGYDGAAWGDLGGGGQGGVNYLADTKDSDFEVDVGNWVAFDDGSVTVPVDGTGGSPTLTCTRNTTTPIRLTGDLKMLTPAVDSQGEGCSVDFDIDLGMQAQKLTGSAWIDLSAIDDDDFAIFVYDKTNTNMIRVNGESLKGGEGKTYFQFQTASNSTSYRLIIMNVDSSNTTSRSLYFDQIAVGPTNLARGSIISDWKDFTGTFVNVTLGTGGTTEFKYRRVGDSVEIMAGFSLGTSGALTGTLGIPMPSGLSIDYGKTVQNLSAVGVAYSVDAGSNRPSGTVTTGNTSNTLYVTGAEKGASGLIWNATVPFTWANTYKFNMVATVPIQGWSSDSVSSEDLGGREIVVEGASNGATPLTANVTPIDFTETRDTTSSWDGSTFTAPETGDYSFDGMIRFSAPVTANIRLYKNTGANKYVNALGASTQNKKFQVVMSLTKGDTVDFRADAGSLILQGSTTLHYIHIQKLASPQTILETETVAARYSTDSEAITNTTTILIFEDSTTDGDTHGLYDTSTGIGTIPVSGWYDFKLNILTGSVAWTVGQRLEVELVVNSSTTKGFWWNIAGAAFTQNMPAQASTSVYLSKGDTFQWEAIAGRGATNLATVGTYNFFSIERVK